MANMDARLAWASKIAAKYGPQVAQLFGLTYNGTSVTGGLAGGNAAEASYGGGIQLSSAELLGSKADLRGNLIHELSHVVGAGYGSDGYTKRGAETFADYARATLNPKENPNWSASAPVLALSNKNDLKIQQQAQAGLDRNGVPVAQPNGPRPGSNGTAGSGMGGNKNTVNNNSSRKPRRSAPPAPPSAQLAYGHDLASAQYDYRTRLAALRQTAASNHATLLQTIAQDKLQGIQDVGSAANNASQRGIVGSSVDYAGRAGAITAMTTADEAARAAALQGRLDVRGQKIEAGHTYGEAQYAASATYAQAQYDALYRAWQDRQLGGSGGSGGGNRTREGLAPATNHPSTYDPQTGGATSGPAMGYTGGVVRGVEGGPAPLTHTGNAAFGAPVQPQYTHPAQVGVTPPSQIRKNRHYRRSI